MLGDTRKEMMTDTEIRRARDAAEIAIEPFKEDSLQPASYDLRVGKQAFASSSKQTLDVSARGVLVIDPGEFAVLETLEEVKFDSQTAAQIGLRSEYARRGLLMLSGPQVDPGFQGILVVRVVNLAPNSIALPHAAPFLTAQLFRLSGPVERPYEGARQGQTGLSPTDVQELAQTEGLTLGEMVKTLGSLARDVAELRGSVSRLSWVLPLIVAFGMALIAVMVTVGK